MTPRQPGLRAAADLASASASPAPASEITLSARLDRTVEKFIAEKRIVGTVVLVLKDGAVVYRRAAGQADREANVPMRADTHFRYASLTKPIVSVAALALVDQGKLGLDEPVTRWLPDFRPKLPDGREPVITVRHLLSHTAGLSYSFFEPENGPYHRAGVSDGLDESEISLEENVRRIASVPLNSRPGEQWAYSLALDVVGAIVEKAGGAPLPEVVARLVTGPLGMKETGFVARDVARLATPYTDGVPQPVRMGEKVHLFPWGGSAIRFSPARALSSRHYPSGGAGMVGTADDFAKFLEALQAGGAPVLERGTTEEMFTAQVPESAQTRGPGWGFGIGGALLVDPQKAASPQSAGTLQWGGAYGHSWFVDRAQHLTVVALTNTALEGMIGAYTTAIRDAVYGSGS